MLRKLAPIQAFIIICCVNAAVFAGWAVYRLYLQMHRPPMPDAAHGFVIRQDIAHSDQVFYISWHDAVLYYGLGAIDVAVFVLFGLIAWRAVRARQRGFTQQIIEK